MGICLGMQLLFDKSYEHGEFEGLGIIKGEVKKFELPQEYKVPHMGWNKINIIQGPLFDRNDEHQYVYFVHSFYCDPDDGIEKHLSAGEGAGRRESCLLGTLIVNR